MPTDNPSLLIESKARTELERVGYLVEIKNKSKVKGNNFWGLFNFVCIQSSAVRLIRLESDRYSSYRFKTQIKKWKHDNHVKIPCEIWLYKGDNDWEIEEVE
jgi:hypothetical protein